MENMAVLAGLVIDAFQPEVSRALLKMSPTEYLA